MRVEKCEIPVHCIMPSTQDSGERMVVAIECLIQGSNRISHSVTFARL